MRRTGWMLTTLAATLAAASGAQGQAPTVTIVRSASPGSVGAVTGWDNEGNAAGGITGGCFAGGDSCRTNTCAADAPTSFPTSQRQTLWATAFSAWTPPSGYTISAVRVDAYGSRTNSQTARWQLRIRGPVSDTTGERQTTAPCDWIYDRSNTTGGSWNVTNALGRPWTVADVNNLDVGVDYFTSAALTNDSFWISGIRQEITVNCAPFTASVSASGTTQLCPNGSVTFTAQGNPDPRVINPNATYQWRLNGVDISGQTSNMLTVSYGSTGTYTCVVSYGCNPIVATNAFTVTARPAATVGTPTANPNPVCPNGVSTLSVAIAGEPPLTLQWFRNGLPYAAPIAGLNPGVINLDVPGSVANATFTAQVTQSGCGESLLSAPVFLAQLILAGISPITPSGNSNVCPGGSVPLSVTISGSPPLTLQWQRAGSGNYGPPQTGLSPGTYSINVPYVDGDATFSAQVSNLCNVIGSPNIVQITKLIAASATPPTAGSVALCPSESTTVCTTLSGTPPFTLQWLRNGQNFGPAQTITQAGQVCVSVSHADAGAAFSANVSNNCNVVPPLPSVTVAARTVASLGTVTTSATNLCPSQSASVSVLVDGTAPVTVQWLRNGAPYQPPVVVNVTPATIFLPVPHADAGATFSARATNVCSMTPVPAPNSVAIDQNSPATISTISLTGSAAICPLDTTQVSVTIGGTGPLTLQWRRNGQPLGAALTGLPPGTYSRTISHAEAGTISACVTNVCTTTALCTTNSVTIVANQPAQITTPSVPTAICPGQASTTCVLLSGTPPFTLQWRRNGVAFGAPITGLPDGVTCLNIPYADANATFSACVTNVCSTTPVCSSGTSAPINIPATATNLRALTPTALCSGQSTTLAVDVAGTTPITLQWRKDGANYGPPVIVPNPGTITRSIPFADSPGTFTACVTNICTINPACTPNSITISRASEVTSLAISPTAPEVCLGGSITLSAAAAPVNTYTYQWFRNTLPIPGATSSTLTIPSARVRDAARYTVSVTSACNSLTSQPADLTVLEHPVWTPLDAPQPVARFGGAMAYDPVRNVTVLFGGQTSVGFRNDTWEWNGQAWALRSPTTPPSVRAFSAMAYDRVRNVMVLVGGRNANGPLSETWEYNGSAWTQQPGASPTVRDRAGMVWDSANNRMVLYGGFGTTTPLGDTWLRNGTTWTNPLLAGPAPRTAWNAIAWDSDRNVAVLFGGDTFGPNNETWEFSGAWVQRANGGPATRFHHTLVYDRSRSRTVLLGGWDGTSIRQGMWEWDGSGWSARPLVGPDPRRDAAMVFDEAREALTLFGGISVAGTVADTWRQRPFGRSDIVSIGQIPFPDGLVTGDDFIGFINAFAASGPLADLVGVGGVSPPDGFITGDDFIAFINTFTFGCP
jgi:hypothetical protein